MIMLASIDAITATNALVSVSILGALGWASVKSARAVWPLVEFHARAKTRKIEADAKLSDAVRINHDRLTGLVDRSVQMQSANTEALARLDDRTERTDRGIEAVYKHLLRGCECDKEQRGAQPA